MTRFCYWSVFVVVFVSSCVLVVGDHSDDYCPDGTEVVTSDPGCDVCRCCRSADVRNYLVRCDNRQLTAVPSRLPSNTTRLWLHGNRISVIDTFPTLHRLRQLKLSDCRTSGSTKLRWNSLIVCNQQHPKLSDGVFDQLTALEELDLTARSDFNTNVIEKVTKLRELTLYCEGRLPTKVQQRIARSSVSKLITFGCGLELQDRVLGDITTVEVKDDASEIEAISLPKTNLELRVSRQSASHCLKFTELRVKTLRLLCKAQALNVTNTFFGDLSHVQTMNFSLEVQEPGKIVAKNLKKVKIDTFSIAIGFHHSFFYRIMFVAMADIEVRNFHLRHFLHSPITVLPDLANTDLEWMITKWVPLQAMLGVPTAVEKKIHNLITSNRHDSDNVGDNHRSKRNVLGDFFRKIKNGAKKVKYTLKKVKGSVKKEADRITNTVYEKMSGQIEDLLRHYISKTLDKMHLREELATLGKKILRDSLVNVNGSRTAHIFTNINVLSPIYVVGNSFKHIESFVCEICDITHYPLHNLHLPNLRELKIAYDSTIDISLDAFIEKTPKLRTVVLRSLKSLRVNFGQVNGHAALSVLDLANNSVTQLVSTNSIIDLSQFINLRHLDLAGSFPNTSICSSSALNYTSQSSCFSVHGLQNLEYFSYADNNARFIGEPDRVFKGMTSLIHLNLRGNKLNLLTKFQLKSLLFPVTRKLESLDLSGNGLVSLDESVFDEMRELRVLRLDNNALTQVSVRTLTRQSLINQLNLGGNQLRYLDPAAFNTKVFLRQLNVSGNLFRCDCELRPFRDWMVSHVSLIHVYGTSQNCYNSELLKFDNVHLDNYTQPWTACDHHWAIVQTIISALSIILVLGVSYAVYYYRYDILYICFLKLKKPNRTPGGYLRLLQGEFDGFLSFSEADPIAYTIHRILENDGFRICIHARDFIPGWAISANIAHFIKRSRKFIFLISRASLASQWASYERELAMYRCFKERKNMMIPIFVENVPHSELPDTLRALIRQVTYLDWPGEDRTRECEVFFKRLKMNLWSDVASRDLVAVSNESSSVV